MQISPLFLTFGEVQRYGHLEALGVEAKRWREVAVGLVAECATFVLLYCDLHSALCHDLTRCVALTRALVDRQRTSSSGPVQQSQAGLMDGRCVSSEAEGKPQTVYQEVVVVPVELRW